METRTLGTSGIAVSAVGVGCNAFGTRIDADQTAAVVHAALDAGVTLFDTADVYGKGASEELLGRALAGRRDEAVLATKFGRDMGDGVTERGTRAYVRSSLEASLRRLGTDHVDLYQMHMPDRVTPLEETLAALDELVREGKVRAIGCSNYQSWELVDANWLAKTRGLTGFVTAQNEYSLLNRQAEIELAPACEAHGVGILPYFPLAYGLLTGKYSKAAEPPAGSRLEMQRARLDGADWGRIDQLQAFADARGISLLELAIGGLAAQRAVASVISGATKPEQVLANQAASQWQPSTEDLAELATIGAPTQSYTTYSH